MKHQFTEDDLKQALRHTAYMDDGLRINIPAWVEDNDEVDTEQVDVFRAILDALPDPEPVADEWEQCEYPEIAFDDVEKGDRIRVFTRYGNIEILTVEERTDMHLLAMGTHIDSKKAQSIQLITRPLQHPDPAEHPVIMGVVTRDGSNHDFGVRNWSTYHVYSDGQSEGFLNSDQITDWEPAKIVRIEEK